MTLLPDLRSMMSLSVLRPAPLPQITPARERELFLHVALLGMTLTVTALLGYIATRDNEEELVIAAGRQ